MSVSGDEREGLAIAKIEAYNDFSKSSYYISVSEARKLTKTSQAVWEGPKKVVLGPDLNLRVSWAVRQSGYAGPYVMQIVAQ